jgi:hypothetical protein
MKRLSRRGVMLGALALGVGASRRARAADY